MNLNKLTEKAQESVLGAQKLAETLGHAQIEPEHLLISLLEQQDGVAPAVLRKMNADPADLARVMRGEIARGPQAYGGAQPGVSPRLNLVVDLAEAEAGRHEGRVRQHGAPAHRDRRRDRTLPRREAARHRAASRATSSSRRSRASADRSASPIRTLKGNTRHSSDTGAI